MCSCTSSCIVTPPIPSLTARRIPSSWRGGGPAGPQRSSSHRPRRPPRRHGDGARAQAARDPADHGRGADARRRHPSHAPVRDARGLHEPLPGAHRLTLAHPPLGARGLDRGRRPPGPARRRAQPLAGGARAARRRGSSASRAARGAARSPRAWRRAGTPRRRRSRAASPGSSARTASASSSSAPSGATTGAGTGCWPSWRSGSACPRSPPATSTCTRASGSRSRTRWSPWASARRSTRPSHSGAATRRTCSRRPSGWRSASASTPTRWRRPAGSPSG